MHTRASSDLETSSSYGFCSLTEKNLMGKFLPYTHYHGNPTQAMPGTFSSKQGRSLFLLLALPVLASAFLVASPPQQQQQRQNM